MAEALKQRAEADAPGVRWHVSVLHLPLQRKAIWTNMYPMIVCIMIIGSQLVNVTP